MRRLLAAGASAAALTAALPATTVNAEVKCDLWGCSDEQPKLTVPVPSPAPAGAYATADFDNDGVANAADNCLLVPNKDQAPAVRPAGAADDPLAVEWKQQNPAAAFRLNSQLGEACSGWNGNWHRSQMGLKMAPEPVKQQIWKFLGEGGPMYGANRLVDGGPVCTDVNDGWVNMIEYALRLPEWDIPIAEGPAFECRTGALAKPFTDFITAAVWSGKRLFTPTNEGGTITNRFFAPITEAKQFEPILKMFPTVFVGGHGQTVNGKVIRGRSYKDGRPAIILDWRGVSGAGVAGFPLPNLKIPLLGSLLVYDECRAMQEGIWPCTANADLVLNAKAGKRKTFQFGWMMWQGIDPDIANWRAWEQANPEWTKPKTYGYAY